MKFFICASLFFMISAPLLAQSGVSRLPGSAKERIKKKIPDHGLFSTQVTNPTRMLGLSGQLNTNGYGLAISYENKKRHISSIWSIGFSEIKHGKEERFKSASPEIKPFGKPKSFIFGKENNIYIFHLAYGRNYTPRKGRPFSNINLGIVPQIGLLCGVIKPYTLRIIHNPDSSLSIQDEMYSPANRELFLSKKNIYGRSSFSENLNRVSVNPGFSMGIKLCFSTNQNTLFTRKMFIGNQISLFYNKMNRMVDEREKRLFYSACIGILIGKNG